MGPGRVLLRSRCFALVMALATARAARASDCAPPRPDAPAPQGAPRAAPPPAGPWAVAGGVAAMIAVPALLVWGSGYDGGRNWVGAFQVLSVTVGPNAGLGGTVASIGFAGVGIYNFVNHDAPATRRWVNAGGMVAAVAIGVAVEELASRHAPPSAPGIAWAVSPAGAAVFGRF